jgi:hypothetical protein
MACIICLESDETIYTVRHRQCIYTVHKPCFQQWHNANMRCIICREHTVELGQNSTLGKFALLIFALSLCIATMYVTVKGFHKKII